MNNLINITTNEQGSQVVSARELHEFLEVTTQFSIWFKRMCEYGFEEGSDFILIKNDYKVSKSNPIDYAITLDMAKEIAMIQRSDKGKQARKYFIEQEKELRSIKENQFSIPQTFEEALRLSADLVKEKHELSLLVSIQKKDIEINKPKVQLAEHIMSDDVTTHKVGQVAKILQGRGIPVIGSKNLYKAMRGFGMVFKGSTEPMQSAINNGYLALKVNEIVGGNGCHIIKKQTLVTNRGIEYLFKKMYQEPEQSSLFN